MENVDSLPVLTDFEIEFATLTPPTLGQPIELVVNFVSPPSTIISSNPASLDAEWDTVSTAPILSSFAVCTTPTVTTNQLQPPKFHLLLVTLEPRFHLLAMHAPNTRRLRRMQRHANKDYDNRGRHTKARQHKREHFS